MLCACGRDQVEIASGAEAAPPTILLVTIDTLRADRVGCYGRADAGTPVIDRIAEEGVRFTNAQTTAPLTLPAHASLLTGRSLPAHGVLNNGTFVLPAELPRLAEQFQRAGWATGAFVSSAVLASRYGLAAGFDRYDDQIQPGVTRSGVTKLRLEERPGAETADRALAWSTDQGTRPVFLWVHFFEPHRPYSPPPALAARHAGDAYQGEVEAADLALGRLVDGLKSLGRGKRLLVVVTADHGESLGEHGEATHGIFLYGATMHVPLVIAGTGWRLRPGVIDEPVSLADLAPTLLDVAGLPQIEELDGASLAPALLGDGDPPRRTGVFAESHMPRLGFGWSGLRVMVAGTRKFIDAPRPELYELSDDPAEAKNMLAPGSALPRESLELDDLVRRARAIAPQGPTAQDVSTEQAEALRSLGYVVAGESGDAGALVDRNAVDPKDRTEFLERFESAVTKNQTGRGSEAAAILRELERVDPRCRAVLFELGQALIQAEQLEEAEAVLRRLVAAHPESGIGWFRLAQLLDHKKLAKDAESAYRKSIATEPRAVEARQALAALLAETGRIREAIELLRELQALDPANHRVGQDIERLSATLPASNP